MNRRENMGMTAILSILILLFSVVPAWAQGNNSGNNTITKQDYEQTAVYLQNTVKNPSIGAIGGDWIVLGLSKGSIPISQTYFDQYYKRVTQHLTSVNSKLSSRKYTEYARVVLALKSIGKDPENAEGHNIVAPLEDFDTVSLQGINGQAFALLALDSGGYLEGRPVRQKYLEAILARQLEDGGFSLGGESADTDVTAMALQALAPYKSRPEVKSAINKGIQCLSRLQNSDGGFSSWGGENSESTAQVILALCQLGISLEDHRFIKEGSLLTSLQSYRKDDGSYRHFKKDEESSLMATEQVFLALTSYFRIEEGKTPIYSMFSQEEALNKTPLQNRALLKSREKGILSVAQAVAGAMGLIVAW